MASLPLSAKVVRRAIQTFPMCQSFLKNGLISPLMNFGHITLREAQALSDVIKTIQTPGPIIEIGTLFGFSTMMIAIAKEPSRELITVDNFMWNPIGLSPDNQEAVATEFLQDGLTNANVRLLRKDKDEFYAEYDGALPALMFLDANHEYEATLHDIRESIRLGAEVICGHDLGPRWPGVARAVEECGGYSQLVDTFWVLRRGTIGH